MVTVLFLNLRGRMRFEWAGGNPWHRWIIDYPAMVRSRVRMMRFNRFSDGESTDDFW